MKETLPPNASSAAGPPTNHAAGSVGPTPSVPLKRILTDFLEHVADLETRRAAEGEDDQYAREFQALKTFSDELKGQEEFSCSEGDKDVNKKKNRYKDILPYNYTRVILSDYPGVPGSDYINANFIKGASGSNAYIASQGPLPHTVNQFWRMVVECEVQVIVMACNEQEAGKHKCECYWTDENERKQYGKFYVSLLKSRDICPDFLVRTIKLEWTSDQGKEEVRTVCQFHYSAWPDHGIPTQVKPLLEMVRLIRDCQASETLPLLIHCSAGCGRTGTICAIDYVFGLLRSGKISSDFSLYNLVKEMRRQRIAMVQTVDQYMLCHRAVRELFLEQLRVIDSHPYENVGDDGCPLVGGSADGEVIPDYETIFVKGDLDIDAVLTQRQSSVPRTLMGTAMLMDRSTNQDSRGDEITEAPNGTESSLPTTLHQFNHNKPAKPVIHDPPTGPSNAREAAPQRFKKGNLRLLQTDDGGWKLEEKEEEKRRSLELSSSSPLNTSSHSASNPQLNHNNNNNNNVVEDEVNIKHQQHHQKESEGDSKRPPQPDKRKKKSSSGSNKGDAEGAKESQLLRRPSMKKIKAFFDHKTGKTESKEAREAREEKENNELNTSKEAKEKAPADRDLSSALAKLPKLENGPTSASHLDALPLSGSKSVPSSLDRKSANLSKYWPLQTKPQTKSIPNQAGKPELPLKRSKSMKSNIKPVSVIPIINQTSFNQYRCETEPSSPGLEPSSSSNLSTSNQDEIIDLRKQTGPSGSLRSSAPSFSFEDLDSASSKHSLSQDYLDRDSIRSQLRDFLTSRHHQPAGQSLQSAGQQLTAAPASHHRRQSSQEDSEGVHRREGSGDLEPRNKDQVEGSGFLELQMAKLLARKGMDEIDTGGMTRSVSGGDLNLSNEFNNARGNNILDDDTRQMLKDCQDYLQGHHTRRPSQLSVEAGQLDASRSASADHSPTSAPGRSGGGAGGAGGGRSVNSSPGNSYSKYQNLSRSNSGTLGSSPGGYKPSGLNRSSGGSGYPGGGGRSPGGSSSHLSTSPHPSSSSHLGTSPHATINKSSSSLTSKVSPPIRSSRSRVSSGGGGSAGGGGMIGPDQQELEASPHYQNIDTNQYCQVTVDAREKVSAAAVKLRNRERRNSFRQAVDRVDRLGRPYERIWFGDERDEAAGGEPSPRSDNIDVGGVSSPIYANASRQLKAGDGSIGEGFSSAKNQQQRLQRSGEGRGSAAAAHEQRLPPPLPHESRVPSSGEQRLPTTLPGQDTRMGNYDNLRYGLEGLAAPGYSNLPFPGGGEAEASDRLNDREGTGSGYEPVNFHQPGSGVSSKKGSFNNNLPRPQDNASGLASALLVAEACRDYERGASAGRDIPANAPIQDRGQQHQPVLERGHQQQQSVPDRGQQPVLDRGHQQQQLILEQDRRSGGSTADSSNSKPPPPPVKQSLQKQNSAGSIRLPPPYQAPPPAVSGSVAPPPPYAMSAGQFYGGGGSSTTGTGGFARPVVPPPPSSASPTYQQSSRNQEVEGTPRRQMVTSTPIRQNTRPPSSTSPTIRQMPRSSTNLSRQSASSGNLPPTSGSGSPNLPDMRPPVNLEGSYNLSGQQLAGQVTRRQPRETIRGVRDDSELPSRTRDEHSHVRHMKRNSSLVTVARLHMQDINPGLILKGGEASRLGGAAGTGPNGPSLIVQGSRTAVHVGGGNAAGPAAAGKVTPPGPTPPGIDIDRVAAMMTSERESVPLSTVAATQGRQLGRSLATALSGAAANIKSRLTGITDPPRSQDDANTGEQSTSSSLNNSSSLSQHYEFPVRLLGRPLGPRDTPPSFSKKQEYL